MAYGTINADVIGTSVAGSNLGAGNASIMKNRIINGAMVIDQRNAGASVSTSSGAGVYTVDRWQVQYSQTSKFTIQQNAGSVTPPTGFTNYLGITSSSAYSIGSGDYFMLAQFIEGYNVADLGWGTANAKTVTLSFWVRSSLTGTFGGALNNVNQDRSYPFTYTISSANTWTQISVTVAGDTTGTWNTTSSQGLRVWLGLGVGSTYAGTAGAWAGAAYFSATGATSVVGTSGATFYITGVQLEVGSSATGYEYRQYTTELALCQRYYIKYSNAGNTGVNQSFLVGAVTSSTAAGICSVNFANPMRAVPTGSYSGACRIFDGSGAPAITSINEQTSTSTTGAMAFGGSGGGLTLGRVALIIPNGSSACYIDFSAEL
jgi:hypothetical protein